MVRGRARGGKGSLCPPPPPTPPPLTTPNLPTWTPPPIDPPNRPPPSPLPNPPFQRPPPPPGGLRPTSTGGGGGSRTEARGRPPRVFYLFLIIVGFQKPRLSIDIPWCSVHCLLKVLGPFVVQFFLSSHPEYLLDTFPYPGPRNGW